MLVVSSRGLYHNVVAGNLVWNLFKGPLEALVGVAVGVVIGIVLWYIPQKKSVSVFLICIFFLCTVHRVNILCESVKELLSAKVETLMSIRNCIIKIIYHCYCCCC